MYLHGVEMQSDQPRDKHTPSVVNPCTKQESTAAEKKTEIVLLGAGHSNIQVLKMLGPKLRSEKSILTLTVINDTSGAWYSGMIPGTVAGLYSKTTACTQLQSMVEWAGAKLMVAKAISVEPTTQEVVLENGQRVGYDILSVDVGSTVSGKYDIPGVLENAIHTRPIGKLEESISKKERSLGLSTSESMDSSDNKLEVDPESLKDSLDVVVVGGGAAGVEMAFAMRARSLLWRYNHPNQDVKRSVAASVTLVAGVGGVLSDRPGSQGSDRAQRELKKRDIKIITGTRVIKVNSKSVDLSDGQSPSCHLCVWACGPAPHHFVQKFNLSLNGGYIAVKDTLQSMEHPNIFAAGDCCHLVAHPSTPKAGVYAVYMGPVLAHNILAFAENNAKGLKNFVPHARPMALYMTGDGEAVGSWKGFSSSGGYVWKLKNYIDQKWMDSFDPNLLPPIPEQSKP